MLDWYLIFATLAAYIVKGMSGFASTLVFSTIMSVKVNNINISPVDLIVGYPSNVILVWKNRKEVRVRIWLPLVTLVILGSIPGAFFLKIGDARLIKIIFGFVVLFLAANMLYHEVCLKKEEKQSKVMLVIIGILSGVLCGLFGIGALLAAYVSRTTENSKEFKGNICMVFLVENTFRMFVYWMNGIITADVLKMSLCLLPVMLLGMGIGMFAGKFMKERSAKRVIIILLMISGAALVWSNLR